MYKKIPAFILAAVFIFALPHLMALRPLIVLSGSMEPAIHTGSLIFIDTKKKDPLPGDIVTIRLTMAEGRETLVTHRVVRIEDGLPVTKGDANEMEERIVKNPAQIVGTFIFQIPYLGYLVSYFRQSFQKFLNNLFPSAAAPSRRNNKHERSAERHLLLTFCERNYEKTWTWF